MLTVVTGVGSAGVTTVSLVWGYVRRALVVEANPAGGDVWAWAMVPDTGLAELAAASLRQGEVTPEQLRSCVRTTPLGIGVVTAPATSKGAAASAAAVGSVLPKLGTDLDVVVDAGRLAAEPDTALLAAADRVLALVVPVAGPITRLAEGLVEVRDVVGGRLTVAVCDVGWRGPLAHRGADIAAYLGCAVTRLPYDPRTAGAVAGRPGALPAAAGRRLGWWKRWRYPLLEAVRRL
jgi:hypothetical protein